MVTELCLLVVQPPEPALAHATRPGLVIFVVVAPSTLIARVTGPSILLRVRVLARASGPGPTAPHAPV